MMEITNNHRGRVALMEFTWCNETIHIFHTLSALKQAALYITFIHCNVALEVVQAVDEPSADCVAE